MSASKRKHIIEASTADIAVISEKLKLDSLVVYLHLAHTQLTYAYAHTTAIALSDTLSLC